jgi:hypothetical protein
MAGFWPMLIHDDVMRTTIRTWKINTDSFIEKVEWNLLLNYEFRFQPVVFRRNLVRYWTTIFWMGSFECNRTALVPRWIHRHVPVEIATGIHESMTVPVGTGEVQEICNRGNTLQKLEPHCFEPSNILFGAAQDAVGTV